MALRPLEVDVQMRHDWTSAPAMHDDEVAQLTAEIERLRAEIRDLSRSTSWKGIAPMRGIRNAGRRLRSALRRTIDGPVLSRRVAGELAAISSGGSLDHRDSVAPGRGAGSAAATGRDSFGVRRPLEPPAGIARDVRCEKIEEQPLARIAALLELERWLERDTLPIPATSDREYYHGDRHFEYWLSGIDDCLKIQASCPEVPWSGARLLDFGGATGRVSRHFYLQGTLSEVTLCDVNINNVAWVLEHFPSDFGAFKNSWVPSLPLPSQHFDVVIAFSVFTHVNEYEMAWLYELRRVLRPGGILYVTVQNDDTWRILPSTVLYDRVKDFESFRAVWQEGRELADRLVVEYSDEVVHNCSTFHPNAYIRRIWGRVLTVADIQPLRHAFQSAVVLRKDA
jgi:SAM-dependent methyltransferase